jgi:PKD repeat protein
MRDFPPRRMSRTPRFPFALIVLLAPGALVAGCGGDSDPTGVEPLPDPTPNQPPVAAFSTSVTEGSAPLEVTFDAGASMDPDGEIVSYSWEFGDGGTGSGVQVTHTYQAPGYFTPRLRVTDDRGATGEAVDEPVIVTIPPGDGAGVIAGTVRHDLRGDGEAHPGDPLVPGTLVYLDLDGTGTRSPGDPFTVTDREGRFSFEGVDTGRSYQVTQELGLGWTNTWAGPSPAPRPAAAPRLPMPSRGASLSSTAPSRIIAGEPAGKGEFPFMVALLFSHVTNNADAFTCGGTFIASRWILTAAHCVVTGTGQVRPPSAFNVLVGTEDLASGGERLPVERIRVFPAFGAESFAGNDVAVLELDRHFMIPRTVVQTRDEPWHSRPGNVATAAGWGMTSFQGNISTLLRKVEMELISNGECQRMLDENVVPSTICAGLLGTTESICSGDSGGPLMVPGEHRWVQVGVTSFGRNCQPPIAFARLAEFTSWIEQQIPPEPSMAVEVDWSQGDSVEVHFRNFR